MASLNRLALESLTRNVTKIVISRSRVLLQCSPSHQPFHIARVNVKSMVEQLFGLVQLSFLEVLHPNSHSVVVRQSELS